MNDKIRKFYSCNEFYFSENNEKTFYWAGFFAADGNVSNRGDINLGVSTKDIDHLFSFKTDLASNAPINTLLKKDRIIDGVFTKESFFSLIRFRSIQISADLKRFNVIPNKTKTYTIPKWLINHELFRHFVRGYFDGDGWFTVRKYKMRQRIGWGICGNFSVVKDIVNYMITNLSLQSNPKIRKQKNIFRIEFTKQNDVLKIVNWMYGESSVFLNRKHKIAKMAEICDKETAILNIKKEDLIESYNRLKSYSLVAKQFGCAKSSISNYMNKYKIER